ncbi:hypothetical protein [Dyella nitratireducens]|uniref:Uncharacterized protein n=1 Tax=Dyella nitratireducens TaxID=1849580 RepID=A0ABQ1G7Z5_9GAMM|nr:hypothetical protein [Dyella nitratireducens]GGA38497.1 hypothetical protein GCM10010981_29650 [Dyella nitratireducens]GLQ40322.1 hypothetical protein GCM10007902_01710 [Dyella nitratireducens]
MTRLTFALSTMALVLLPWFAQACDFTPVRIVQSVGKVGDITVNFGEADDAQHPTAWQGPLQISVGGAPACPVSDEVSIIEDPVILAGDVLYVPTYSGSNNYLYAVDVKTCKVIWHSSHFAGKTVLKKGRLFAGKDEVVVDRQCRPSGPGGK